MNTDQNLKNTLTTRNIKTIKLCSAPYDTAPVLVAINHRNQSQNLVQALTSIEEQSLFHEKRVQVVILDDHSNEENIKRLVKIADKSYITLIRANCGSASQARNTILDWADTQNFVQWIARLDADDQLAMFSSLQEVINIGEQQGKSIVLAGNQLSRKGRIDPNINYPLQNWINEPATLVEFIDRFCHGQEKHELPSCNLILANKIGVRYPNIKSAEDHWLVAMLLLLRPNEVALAENSLYCTYNINGNTTQENKTNNSWVETRHKLAYVVKKLFALRTQGLTLLGFGMEGVVYEFNNKAIKEFHPWGIKSEDVIRLQTLTQNFSLPIVQGDFIQENELWLFKSQIIKYIPVSNSIPYQKIVKFLRACYLGGIAPTNIKRDNLMYHPNGDLHYVDIGKDLKPLNASYFIDLSARLYAIGVLEYSDFELARRKSILPQEKTLEGLDGFKKFYATLITQLHQTNTELERVKPTITQHKNTTLLIKACAQDANGFYEQICHIVTQLEFPRRFAKKLLLIDLFEGPFLRQYDEPNLDSLLEQALKLVQDGVINNFVSAPNSTESIKNTYKTWFNNTKIIDTHTSKNAPLYNQIWAFDQIETRYVLQCDCDVLIGRKNWHHDFVADMLAELQKPDVQSVGFNIPKYSSKFLPYFGEPGQFAPEVRFGMIDLVKFKQALPIVNPVSNGNFQLTWHRAMQRHEKNSGELRSVRGGNPSTFYVHPCNIDKERLQSGVIRDLIAQGKVPAEQQESFDLVGDAKWNYEYRNEEIIFLLKGRNTSYQKLMRCVNSLNSQEDQKFGVIIIDDGSSITHSWAYPKLFQSLKNKTTMIRHIEHKGRMPNFIQAIYEVCVAPSSMIVVLDQDDFLMSRKVVCTLKQALKKGHDVVQMPMFRPNKPLKQYQPDYRQSRNKYGANVWAHLRAFTKACFMKIPNSQFKKADGQWFDCVTDFATMLPLCEVAASPIYIDIGYAYWHEREDYPTEYKQYQKSLLADLLSRKALSSHNNMPELEPIKS
ncbi:glycosyltransferase family 2 protein [Pseudoalteromonas sp. G4]|uniref:glycosyltransferase family 2 protein n=1 Tax=Pseudoalteromonas sp. G4 TaxID=2992761 RepID=UPI00237E31BB|nr:glycosyltransferase family 2 protein [Pseudoalteromonas sp. G4]MDE3271397.1 glycosyltransferase [Pseudoalteromonas sp. G4]